MTTPAAPRRTGTRATLAIFAVLFGLVTLVALDRRPTTEPVYCSEANPPVAPTVVMLSATWCGYCARARQLFAEHAIDYCEYDVERSATGRTRYERGPRRGVPVIAIGERTLLGFDREALLAALDGAGLLAATGR